MPLLLPRTIVPEPPGPTDPEVPGPPIPEPPPPEVQVVAATWTAPDGTVLNLMDEWSPTGVMLLSEGVAGLGAAPRSVSRVALPTGGSAVRWSRADERIVTLPLMLQAPTPDEFLSLRRQVTRAFTQTTPAAGMPTQGTLRITRGDGSWREISGVYLSGLEWEDSDRKGVDHDVIVVQLLCDPWWRGESVQELEFAYVGNRDYLSPYETVSPDRTLGEATVNILGDVDALPVWTITGPATSVTVRYPGAGPGWTFGAIAAGVSVTIDVEKSTVTDSTGANRIANVAWPTSRLFTLRPGRNDLLLSITGGIEGTSSIRLTYRPRWETA